MALTYTPENPDIGIPCPPFRLPAVDGKKYDLEDFTAAEALVVMFICNHCPYVQAIEDRIIALAHSYEKKTGEKKVQFVGICSNDPTNYPDDSPENLRKRWKDKDYRFPYLIDETQAVAKAFGAVCTPDFFVYDRNRRLAYRGRLDDSWKEPEKVTQEEMRRAIDRVLDGQPPVTKQNPSMGCSIKWKK